VDPKVFRGFKELAYQHAGIALRENKEVLVSARIAKRVRILGLDGDSQYLDYLMNDKTGAELLCFIDVISTNFTSFFREADHFETLEEELAERVLSGTKRIRVWCAAAATGEEPYTLGMTLSEALDGKVDDWRLLATDISLRALEVARQGSYESTRLEEVPKALRLKYFHKDRERPDGTLRASQALRDKVTFKRLNLATPPFPLNGGLDVVFCRNVMIYFDLTVRQRLITEVERLLRPGGMLIIAHSETLSGIVTGLKVQRPSVYRKAS
jgi:chemotaxis protein methyltransferase CheR